MIEKTPQNEESFSVIDEEYKVLADLSKKLRGENKL